MKDNSEMITKNDKTIVIVGLIFITVGIIFNEWIVAILISPDGKIGLFTNRVIIWVFDCISILIGLLIIKYKSYIRISGKEIIFSIAALILIIFFMEGGLRSFYFIKKKIHSPDSNFSEYIGWQTAENQSWKKNVEEYGEVIFTTSKYGFRVFGDVTTNKTKIFVLGDSYTHGTTVSDGDLYYDYLKKNNSNIEIFAYGSGGYGSLQEYMILDKYIDMINPDLILWQWCSNDYINNSHELESDSYINNNHNTRPYYINGQIKYLYPRQDYGWIYGIVQRSYLLKTIDVRLNILKYQTIGTIEDRLSADHPLVRNSMRTTSEIMDLVKKRAGNTPIVVFMADNFYGNVWIDPVSDMFKKHNIPFIKNIPDELQAARAEGITVTGVQNPHWNKIGHAIAGKVILDYLIENKLLESG